MPRQTIDPPPSGSASVRLPLDRIDWRAVGHEIGADEPHNHLHASIVCGDANLHVDAIEVHTTDRGLQEAVDPAGTPWLEGLAQLTGAFDRLETVTIGGRQYILVITPFAT